MKRFALQQLFIVLAVAATTVSAQTPEPPNPDQEYLRQQERERLLREREDRRPDVRLPVEKDDQAVMLLLKDDETPCFPIQRIELEGEEADRFQWALPFAHQTGEGRSDPVWDRCLGTQGINLVMRRMQNAIVANGYVTTRILASSQDLTTGVLRLTLVPGRIRDIRFAQDSEGQKPGRGTYWNALPAQSGDLLNLRDIEQALENFKRVPTAEADIKILPAEGKQVRPGESDLSIIWKQATPFRLSLTLDDSGSESTGKYQGGMTFSYDHWLTLNDLFYLSLNSDLGGGAAGERGSRGRTVYYSIPSGYWMFGVTVSESRYLQTVAGATQSYRYSGESQNGEVSLSRLVYRDAVRKTTLSLSGWSRASRNYIDDTEVEVQRRRMAGIELGASHREFIAKASLELNLKYRHGTGAKRALEAPEEAFGEGTSRPSLIKADARLKIPFEISGKRFSYDGNWRAQWNRTPLVPQDRFSIGGRGTVRGFDGESSLVAERGWVLRNDLGFMLGDSGTQLYLGLDYGAVGGGIAQTLIGDSLSGATLGMRGSVGSVGYDMFVSAPLSKPENFRTDGSVAGFNLSISI